MYIKTISRENLSCGFLTELDSNQIGQIQTLAKNEILDEASLDIILSKKQTVKALIRLRVCAGWSEPLLVAHTCTTLLEISCRVSIYFD